MSYIEKTFGVKIREYFVAVEEADLFSDISKYDFLLKDRLVKSYNGNDTYRIDVMTEIGKEAIINGWKLQHIELPGNWFGQSSYFSLIDKYGDIYNSKKSVLDNLWYNRQPVMMIRETLLCVLNFTNENHSAKYARVTEGLDVPSVCYNIDELGKFTEKVNQYIHEYQEIQKLLKDENAEEYVEHLNECFYSQLSKCYSFKVKPL